MSEDLQETVKSNGLALIPFLVFIVIYLGAGIILQAQGVEMAFYQFPAVVAILIATIIAFLQFHKAGINSNFSTFAKGAGNEDVMCMLMIFLLAGAFSADKPVGVCRQLQGFSNCRHVEARRPLR